MKRFWTFRNSVESGTAELLLYGDIASEQSWLGDEITPSRFVSELQNAIRDTNANNVNVRINSGGGDVFAAQAIGNYLEQCGVSTTAYIDGLCASAATIVACHCDEVVAAPDSTYMIHPVSMYCGYAGATELQTYLDALVAIRQNIVSLYARKSGHSEDETAAWMDATSWWTAIEAQQNGFVDKLVDNVGNVAIEDRSGVLFVNKVNMGRAFSDAPEFLQRMQKQVDTVDTKEETDVEIKTADELRQQYPDLVNALMQQAAEDERKRIHSIEDMALPGCETLTEKAKYDAPMSASDYAIAVIKETKAQGSAWLGAVKQDAESSGVNSVPNAPAPELEKRAGDPVAQAKADVAKYLGRKERRA